MLAMTTAVVWYYLSPVLTMLKLRAGRRWVAGEWYHSAVGTPDEPSSLLLPVFPTNFKK